MNLRTIILLSLIVSIQWFTLISVLCDNGYLLIIYYEGEDPQPGDTVIIKAELYRGEKRITYSISMRLSIKIFTDENFKLEEETSMKHKGNGLFTYSFTVPLDNNLPIPSDYNYLWFSGQISAYVNGEIVETNRFSFILDIKKQSEQEFNLIKPFHMISPTEAVFGDTIQVITLISQVKEGKIDPNYVNITVEFKIHCANNGTYVDKTYNKTKSIYQTDGYFLTCYTIPSNLDLNFTFIWGGYLYIEIFTNYSRGDPFDCNLVDKMTVPIGGGFNIITKYDVYEKQIDYHILTLNYDFQPVSNISFVANLSFHNEKLELFENSTIFLNNTNNEGRSTLNIPINSTTLAIDIAIHVKKGNISFVHFDWISLLVPDDYYNYNEFHILPTVKSPEYYYSYYDHGYWVEYQAFMGNLPINDKEIIIYVMWNKGIIQISTEKTDSKGFFKLLFSWPSDFKPAEESLKIIFSYYNGSDWFNYYDYFHFYFYFYPLHTFFEPEFVTIQENLILKIESINYSDYQISNFSCNLPPKYINSRFGLLQFKLVYANTVFWYIYGLDTFYYYHSFSYPESIPPSGVIQTSCLIDTSKELEYIIVELYLLDESSSTYHRLVWFLNPDGTLRELPKTPTKSLIEFDPGFVQLLGRTTLFIIVVSTCIVLILWTRHRSIKM